jgi:hypothetical protein
VVVRRAASSRLLCRASCSRQNWWCVTYPSWVVDQLSILVGRLWLSHWMAAPTSDKYGILVERHAWLVWQELFDQAQLDEFFVLWMEYRLMKQRESIARNTNGDHKDDRMLEIYDLQVLSLTVLKE